MATFFGDAANNTFNGGAADDIAFGAGGNDTLDGGGGNDQLFGDSGNDLLIAGPGQDFLYGGEGNDTLDGTAAGADNLFGGVGNDVYIVDSNADTTADSEAFNQGIDTVRSSALNFTLDANFENLVLIGPALNGTGNNLNNQITGNSANNVLSGQGGNDTIAGGAGNDTITGGVGNDNLNGGAGNDNINGGAGDDTLAGGTGNDILIDGDGNDRFLFNTAVAANNIDTVSNLSVGSDKIVLDKTIFSALATAPGGVLLATDFAIVNNNVAAALSADEIVYNRQNGDLFYNPNGAAPGFGVGGGQFATLTGSPNNVSNTDFLVIA